MCLPVARPLGAGLWTLCDGVDWPQGVMFRYASVPIYKVNRNMNRRINKMKRIRNVIEKITGRRFCWALDFLVLDSGLGALWNCE